ncbi:MAG: M23 family metallopeptidase, partial [Thermodesulfobacteriota bacterium]|nr:M23 family metallopeptidase [Thermodesulfobacteriota bacterium]
FYEPEVLVCRSFPIYEYGKDWDYFLKSSYSLEDDLQELLDVLDEQKEKWNTLPSVLPVKTDNYWFSSGFGWRKSPFTGLRHFHSGLDISAKRGTPIIATADGIVSSVKHEGPLGKTVRIRHNAQYSTVYGHMLKYAVKRGKSVKRGQIIGYVGNTGRSTGYHVHYEVKKNRKSINPFNYILNTKKSGTLIASK